MQETQFEKKGKFKLDKYIVFEAIRKNKEQGGSILGVHESLKPVLISEYQEEFELIVIETKIANKNIRIITGYGPQEHDTEKMKFFNALEKKISSAQFKAKSLIIAMDANSKEEIIPDDPKPQSEDGEILAGIINRHTMCVINGLTAKRKGLITRERQTIRGIERSVIDFVITSNDLVEHIKSIHIDDERVHVLTKSKKTKDTSDITKSDHNVINTVLE